MLSAGNLGNVGNQIVSEKLCTGNLAGNHGNLGNLGNHGNVGNHVGYIIW